MVHLGTGPAPVPHAMADPTEEVTVGYHESPVIVPALHGKLHSGGYLPGTALSALLTPLTGHVLVTIAPGGGVAPADLTGVRQILVADHGTGTGYDDALAAPTRNVARRLGLHTGCRVLVRGAPGQRGAHVWVLQVVAGVGLAVTGIGPIKLLFLASLIAGIATPIGLIMLTLAAGNPALVGPTPIHWALRAAGWLIVALVTTVSLIYLAQQLHPIGARL
ncbi:hypothetical protein [Phytohabitans suffuscus]|uniref:Uncharacterized protein n=1 Tax=Phytohabitans suffuscus TaxID=624315 RepID=A0A6F8YAW2_9ACTN|nr:hypothetical protein [Phytohabitans suffuscus]BCB83236.1 hypothetical protein Psuf_005490 [Phytohabitans suffuscus]